MIYEINDTADYFMDGYFEWIAKLLRDREHNTGGAAFAMDKSRFILETLFRIPFRYSMQMDSNRHDDGIDLRYRYAYENGLPLSSPDEAMYEYDCNMLEMMAALALRIEEHIMSDPDVGDRTPKWFWDMIKNMGLDVNADTDYKMISEAVNRITDHTYAKNGKGGLFTVNDTNTDM